MKRYYPAMRGAVEAHGGTVVKLMGDGVMAAFGVPRVAEDDAIRAVRAGVAMQDAFRKLARKELAAMGAIGLRVGINTGEVVVSAGNTWRHSPRRDPSCWSSTTCSGPRRCCST